MFLKPASGDSKREGQVCMLDIRDFGDPTKQDTIDAALRVFVPLAEKFQKNLISREQLYTERDALVKAWKDPRKEKQVEMIIAMITIVHNSASWLLMISAIII